MTSIERKRRARAKLTPEQVWAIRRSTRPVRVQARDYGVSRQTITNIRTRATWWHL